MQAEKRRMQQVVENTMAQLKNSQVMQTESVYDAKSSYLNQQEDVIDRALISNLIISYFKRKRFDFIIVCGVKLF
jgi:aminopeptidase N